MADFDPKLLRRARELSGLSLRELAARAGVHITSLTRFENGLTPSEESWRKLEFALKGALAETGKAIAEMSRMLERRGQTSPRRKRVSRA